MQTSLSLKQLEENLQKNADTTWTFLCRQGCPLLFILIDPNLQCRPW